MSDDADLMDKEIFDEFVAECRENLAEWEDELMQLADAPDDDHAERLHKIFRAAHSIKGAAGFLELKNTQHLAHTAENLLAKMRDGEMAVTQQSIDALLKSTDMLAELLDLGFDGESKDVSEPLGMLNAILNGEPPPAATDESASAAAEAEASPGHEAAHDDASADVEASTVDEAAPAVEAGADDVGAPPTKTAEPKKDAAKKDDAKKDETKADDAKKDNKRRAESADETVRVRTQLLDEMMEKIGELVISRNQLLRRLAPHAAELGDVNSTLHQLSMITSEVQELIMSTRLQPVSLLFRRFPRLVREIARKLGKDVVLEVDDAGAELDRTLIEALADPLTHLVRNSMDHGIEQPEVREAAGKSSRGTVTLRAVNESGMVNIEVIDDGAGLDPVKIGAKGVEKGIISEDDMASMSDKELANLIFAPGFSTAAAVTDLSGRGVGMDVVRTNISNLGGTVEVSSVVGAGSTFTLKLPLTLAIVTSLIVELNGRLMALPQVNLEEVLRLSEDKDLRVENVGALQVLRVRGHLVPIVRLDHLLGFAPVGEDTLQRGEGYVLLVQAGDFRYGIHVDTIHDSEEMVVKPMPKLAQATKCFSGTSILGDGRIALILDPLGVAEDAAVAQLESQVDELLDDEDDPFDLEMKLVKFSNGGDEHFGVPMSLVGRIEKIPATAIHPMGKREFVERSGRAVEVLRLDNLFNVDPPPATPSHYTLIVPKSTQRSIGFLAVGMCDVVSASEGIERSSLASDTVVGTVLEGEELIAVIDIFGVENKLFGDAGDHANERQARRVLIAEDSPAFQEMQRSYFESVGFEVDVVEDGELAWEALRAQPYDVLVSDICMPNVDGIELIRRIRQDEALRGLPAVAVTTLRSDSDRDRILDAGFNAYELKVDRHRLIDSVNQVMSRQHEEAA